MNLQETLKKIRGKKKRPQLGSLAGPLVGVVAVALAVFVSTKKTPLQLAQAPVAPLTTDKDGLVPLTRVTYGPDIGHEKVDPTFEPSKLPPSGVGFYAQTGKILWGAGDRLAVVRKNPLTPAEEATLRVGLTEVLGKVRESATLRKLPTSNFGAFDPILSFDGEGFLTRLRVDTFSVSTDVRLKLPPQGIHEKDASRIIKRSVEKVLRDLQASLTWQGQATRGGGSTG